MYRYVPLRAFEHDLVAVLAVDERGIVQFCNRAACSLLRCDPDATLGHPCWRLARLRTIDGQRFCSTDCPVQRQARTGAIEPLHKVLLQPRRRPPAPIELVTFLIAPPTSRRFGLVHFLRQDSSAIVGAGPDQDAPHLEKVQDPRLDRLSHREMDVLGALAAGLDTKDISARLSLSPLTVRNHIESILHKLGVHRRLEAVLALLGHGP